MKDLSYGLPPLKTGNSINPQALANGYFVFNDF